MNVLSLFAGIGGLDLGLERAGMTVVGQVEIDPFCRSVLARHWPEVPRHDDVRTCVEWWLGEPRPAVDVVAGGFPCQPVSSAGRRRAQEDERWLWPEMATVIRDLRPRYAIMENVPGLLARGMGDVLGDLAEIGYDAEWDCVPAAAVGAPHRRDRVFIVANAGREQSGERHGPASSRRWTISSEQAGLGGGVVADPECEPGRSRGTGDAEQGPRGRNTGRGGLGSDVLADPHGSRREPWGGLGWAWPAPVRDGWWATEPDVGRVAHGVPAALDGGLLVVNAHPRCFEEARAAGSSAANRVRVMWGHDQSAAASSRPSRCVLCRGPLSDLSQEPGSSTGDMGCGTEEGQDVHGLWQELYELQPHAGEDLLAGVPVADRQGKRAKAVGSRVDRLRGLGNAVVPQVAEHIGRLVMEAA